MVEQHNEMQKGRRKKDNEDLKKFTYFLMVNNHFTQPDKTLLVNIATGVVARSKVNVEDAVNIGKKIHAKLDGCEWQDIEQNGKSRPSANILSDEKSGHLRKANSLHVLKRAILTTNCSYLCMCSTGFIIIL